MLLSHFVLGSTSAATAKLTTDRTKPPKRSVILVVDNRDTFFTGLAQAVTPGGFQVVRATSADEATQRLRDTMPDLILANCELPDESGWLMVSKWCLTRNPKRVWLYQAWPAVFDHHWVELTKVEQILYHRDNVQALADQVRSHLKSAPGRLWRVA